MLLFLLFYLYQKGGKFMKFLVINDAKKNIDVYEVSIINRKYILLNNCSGLQSKYIRPAISVVSGQN